MSFDVRCTFCQAKLRLDEEPEPGTEIDCPKCEKTFKVPKAEKKEEPAPEPKKEKKPKVKKPADSEPRTFMPSGLLFAIVGGIVFFIALILGIIQWRLNAAGGVVLDTIDYVHPETRNLDGVNIKQMKQFSGYKTEMDKCFPDGRRNRLDKLLKFSGKDSHTILDYYICSGEDTEFFVLNSSLDSNYLVRYASEWKDEYPDAVRSEEFPIPDSNAVAVRVSTTGRSDGGNTSVYLFMPHRKLLVRTTNLEQLKYLTTSRYVPRITRFTYTMGRAGKLAVRGHIWSMSCRPKPQPSAGDQEPDVNEKNTKVGKEMLSLEKAFRKTTTFSTWISIGGNGVRFAGAIEMDSTKDAENLVKAMKSGPLGKGDESVPPNEFKQTFSFSQQKAFMEFMQYLEFLNDGPAAYFKSRVNHTNAKEFLTPFNPDKNKK